MNSIEELGAYGIDCVNAEMMLTKYREHIGEKHGDYTIVDMTYVGNQTREIRLRCSCGDERNKTFVNRRNKLSELPTICPKCREKRKAEEKKKELEEREKAREIVIQKEIGKEYGDYRIEGHKDGKYECVCKECGAIKHISDITVMQHKWTSTRCTKHYVQEIKYDESYIGRKENMLEVIGITRNAANKKVFLCRCDCGNTTMVQPVIWATGQVKSCGCFQENRSVNANEKERIGGIFRGMVKRCYNKDDKAYPAYGGRGIKICREWLENKEKFIEWSFSHGYTNKLTIERNDVNGDYCPENCRWATYKEQYKNCRPRKKV